jgi:hypothetical protein
MDVTDEIFLLETNPIIKYLLLKKKNNNFGLMIFLQKEKNLENFTHFFQNFWFNKLNFLSICEFLLIHFIIFYIKFNHYWKNNQILENNMRASAGMA